MVLKSKADMDTLRARSQNQSDGLLNKQKPGRFVNPANAVLERLTSKISGFEKEIDPEQAAFCFFFGKDGLSDFIEVTP
ncbi:MAG: hypothetical protein OIF54_00515, partial [Cohaesibacter sp.]|nr:hypothetical protein [Cohaesibacter sp.]